MAVDDPFLVRSPREVDEFLSTLGNTSVGAFSVDVKDLYYSLPQGPICEAVSDSIEKHGVVRFQNSCGTNVSAFLELLKFYLRSTFIEYAGDLYIQKEGVCIGSCLAPVLSDLLLASMDRQFQSILPQLGVIKTFRFVDDYLVMFEVDAKKINEAAQEVFATFKSHMEAFQLTMELPSNGQLRFLDLAMTFNNEHTCWEYAPRSQKGLLPFCSAHSKLVKRGVAMGVLSNALNRSCPHQVQHSFDNQVSRLKSAGYPCDLVCALASRLLRALSSSVPEKRPQKERQKTAVIPYVHGVSHALKKIVSKAEVRLVFSAPKKLGRLCKRVNTETPKSGACVKKHMTRYVDCVQNVVYEFPLSPCGRTYIGQTGRCLNDRLREHANSVRSSSSTTLATHCASCGCAPLFHDCVILARYFARREREIFEAFSINKKGGACISEPSVSLLEKEMLYLS